MDAPIACLVGVSQGAACNRRADPHVVELVPLCAQTGLNVAQTFAIGELRKRHAQILVQAGEGLDLVVAAIAGHASAECVQRQMVDKLRKDELAGVHASPPKNH